MVFVLIRFLNAGDDVPSQRRKYAPVTTRDVKTTERHLLTHCKESNQCMENSLSTMNTTRWHKDRKENPRSTNTPCLTPKLSKETGQLNQLNGARRSRSLSFILSPHPSPFLSKAFLAVTNGLLQKTVLEEKTSKVLPRSCWVFFR